MAQTLDFYFNAISSLQAITMMVKNVKASKISETQLQVLLGYAEEDIYDQSRQATAFGLLKVTSRMDRILKFAIVLHIFVSLRHRELVCLPLSGHPRQEAGRSGDGAIAEESGHAVRHRQQQHDQSPLPAGTSLMPLTVAELSSKKGCRCSRRCLCVLADLPEVPAGLPAGPEAEGPPELCGVAADIRA